MTKSAKRPALFLDRDGVINRDDGYVHTPGSFVFNDGIFDIADAATRANWPIVVVTNQSGIGRGYYTETAFQELTNWMCKQFAIRETPIRAVYHCPFHRDASDTAYRVDNHPDRKPNPGMLLKAAKTLELDLARSIMIGDRWSDIQAAQNAGLAHAVLVGEEQVHPAKTVNISVTCSKRLGDVIPVLSQLMETRYTINTVDDAETA